MLLFEQRAPRFGAPELEKINKQTRKVLAHVNNQIFGSGFIKIIIWNFLTFANLKMGDTFVLNAG